MEPLKVERYVAQRQAQASLPVKLYALFDALLYARVPNTTPLERSAACVALFDRTPDASLADAGPWVVDLDATTATMQRALRGLADSADGISWLISAYPLPSLAEELRERLDVRMPDGRMALLRFYDARIIGGIASMLSFTQRVEFFVPTFDWLAEINGELTIVHPHA
ncbi:hypothetical protein A9R05_42655 (plasmid) [Burkholderia sp. KK1]|uniref:DUF4123 domain-containing protein n=1 Tax=Burkholderia sp. M701 TaxID=326454 RepID=V5YN22_9BURK|nr:DUF4123 domain-containing protein [Burkholderia sp. M701]AQH05722.1 hypothetical protein A9R05_42655 [Burkholderia sp. KK1]BAO18960.1 hypothetical protein [Burkholderia sp. M701]